jgi:hypothetical protein
VECVEHGDCVVALQAMETPSRCCDGLKTNHWVA